jgi:hypothetical protein
MLLVPLKACHISSLRLPFNLLPDRKHNQRPSIVRLKSNTIPPAIPKAEAANTQPTSTDGKPSYAQFDGDSRTKPTFSAFSYIKLNPSPKINFTIVLRQNLTSENNIYKFDIFYVTVRI